MLFESATDFERAFHWLFRALVKNQRHPVTGGDLDQSGRGFGVLKLLRRANGLSQFVNRRALIVNRKLRVANNVDEQDMGDLELDLFLNFGGHLFARTVRKSSSYIKLGAGCRTETPNVQVEGKGGSSSPLSASGRTRPVASSMLKSGGEATIISVARGASRST